MEKIECYFGENCFVSCKKLKKLLPPDEYEDMMAHPPTPYLALEYDENYKARLEYNRGPPFAFLTVDAFDQKIDALFQKIVDSEAIEMSSIYNMAKRMPVTPPVAPEPQAKLASLLSPEYAIHNETKIQSSGVVSTQKVEKKIKQGSIMAFLKKK